jgi:hypothetical protein
MSNRLTEAVTNGSKTGASSKQVWVKFFKHARNIHKLEVDGKHQTGVYPLPDGQGFRGDVRMYTPDGVTASVSLRKYFYITQYGSTSDEYERAAVAFRRKHTLREGMVAK